MAASAATSIALDAWAPSVYLKIELEFVDWRASVFVVSRPMPALRPERRGRRVAEASDWP